MKTEPGETGRARGMWLLAGTLAAMLIASAGPAAAGSAALTCEGTKLQRAGEYNACLLTEEGKATKAGRGLDFTRCETKFAQSWRTAEARSGGACPTSGDETAMRQQVFRDANDIAFKLTGVRFFNNLDGTLTDLQTGLMWELKHPFNSPPNPADPQNPSNTYAWSATGSLPDGTVFTSFLARMNNCTLGTGTGSNGFTGGFAGYCDWRLPTIEELQSIVPSNCNGGTNPCLFLEFGPNVSDFYWSALTTVGSSTGAWFMNFGNGQDSFEPKSSRAFVRAVRTIH
jgi:hypothetical protein